MTLDIDLEQDLEIDSVFSIVGINEDISHSILLLLDQNRLPLVYYSDILTPVCIDSICKPLYIELYWDLVGNYAGFGIYPREKLSKYDHELFTDEDYQKLDGLLKNKFSSLERKTLSELYTEKTRDGEVVKYNGQEVDGITGATVQEIKDEVVEGALYSCYTLWHLSYGEVKSKIRDHLKQIKNGEVIQSLLGSSIEEYRVQAILLMTEEEKSENIERIAGKLLDSSPLNRGKILKTLPSDVFMSSSFGFHLYGMLDKYDFNTITLALENLHSTDVLSQARAIQHLDALSKNQIKILLGKCDLSNIEVLNGLKSFASNPMNTYAYVVKSHLERSEF